MRDGWVETTLGDIAGTVSPTNPTGEEQRYVGLEHFDSGSPRLSRWDSTANFTSTSTQFKAGDVLFSKLRPYLRKVAVPDFDGRCTTEALVYRPSVDALEAGYLGLLLQSEGAIAYADGSSSGSRMPRTSAKIMALLSVAVPPLGEQRRIVDLIGALDDTIAAAESAAVSARKATVAVVGRPWDSSVRREPVARTIAYMLGGTWGSPSGSDEVDVMALGPRSYAGRLAVDESTAMLRSLSTKRAADRVLQRGDIVLERSGGTATQPVGRVVRMTGDASNVVPSDFQRLLRPDPAIVDPGYLFWQLWAAYEAGRTIPFQKATTNIRNLNIPAYLAGTSIALPTMDAQREHAALADSFASTLERIAGVLAELRTLRSNLLTALLSGEHEVPASYDPLIEEVA